MKKISLLISLVIFSWFNLFSIEPDILVTQEGESLKVYNLDITSGENIYFSLEEGSNAPLHKILKSDLLIIKKADGTKIDPSLISSLNNSNKNFSQNNINNSNVRGSLTFNAIEDDFTHIGNKDENLYILIQDSLGNKLNLRLISKEDNTLSVAKARKECNYNVKQIIIPDYVNINGSLYTIISIDEKAFKGKDKINEISFPNTLVMIGEKAFEECYGLNRIVLPETLKIIGRKAFYVCGIHSKEFDQIYIPKSVTKIGDNAFRRVGMRNQQSYNNYYKGSLTSIPDWINIGNCLIYGIDEEAVEEYERRIGVRNK